MRLASLMKKLKDVFFSQKEHVYRSGGGGPPIYIIGDGVLKIKMEDMHRFLRKINFKPLDEEGLKKLGYEVRIGEEKSTAEAGETPAPAQKNSLRRPEGAD